MTSPISESGHDAQRNNSVVHEGRAASRGTNGATRSDAPASSVRAPTPDTSSGTAGSGPAMPSARPQEPREGGAGGAQMGGQAAPADGEHTGSAAGLADVARQAQIRSSWSASHVFLPPREGAPAGQSGGSRPKGGERNRHHTQSGRLMSYADAPNAADRPAVDDPAKAAAREAIGKVAVEYFIATQASRWKALVPMPHNNPGFDVKAVAHDGSDEFIEVKGQGAGWTEAGVALTPTELMTAQKHGDRYWLCVVEHAEDKERRALYLLQNPYGLTQQFRFELRMEDRRHKSCRCFCRARGRLVR